MKMKVKKDMALVLDEILHCGEAMVRIAHLLRGIMEETEDTDTSENGLPETPAETEPAVQQVKEPVTDAAEAQVSEEKITFTDVRTVLAQKAKLGKAATIAVRDLIRKYGGEKLSDVKPEMYANLLREAEVIGVG